MKTKRKQSSGRRVKNAALWFYILAMGCIVIQLMSVIYHFNGTVDFRWLQQVSTKTLSLLITNSIADALILLLPFVALPPKWRKWIWIVLWLVTFWCLAQLLYIPSYRDLMPFSSFLLVGNVGSEFADSEYARRCLHLVDQPMGAAGHDEDCQYIEMILGALQENKMLLDSQPVKPICSWA